MSAAERCRKWREANPEKARESRLRWHKNHPDRALNSANKLLLKRAYETLGRGGIIKRNTFDKFPELKEHPTGKLLWIYYRDTEKLRG